MNICSKILSLFIFLIPIKEIRAQGKIDSLLKRQLDSIMILDQKFRNLIDDLNPNKKYSLSITYKIDTSAVETYLWKEQFKIDSSNLSFIEKIISIYGYPGLTLVGEKTNQVAWYVIQHSTKIEAYIRIIKKAGKNKELPATCVAQMEDRKLVQHWREQVYGTQFFCAPVNVKIGKTACIVWPIKNPKFVNVRRKKVGFTSTVEESAKEMNIKYSVVKLKDFLFRKVAK